MKYPLKATFTLALPLLLIGLMAGCDSQPSAEIAAHQAQSDAPAAPASAPSAAAASDTQATQMAQAPQAEMGLTDAVISQKAKDAIQAETKLKGLNIDVSTAAGVVTLTGSVNSLQSRELAQSIVQTVGGVKSVNNRLSVGSAG